ncbi:MAG: NTPase [Candidatus Methanofastidiosia archaeon]|jgi:nucleoside-triphosphatase THEP1
MNILITGKPGIGKTTLIQNIVQSCDNVAGFYTKEIRKNGQRVGFAIKTMDGKTGVLAHIDIDSPVSVSKYKVNIPAIENICVPSINFSAGVIVIDEIGKMELYSESFKDIVLKALDTKNVVATIMERSHPFCNTIKKRKDTILYGVTKENRDELVDTIKRNITC